MCPITGIVLLHGVAQAEQSSCVVRRRIMSLINSCDRAWIQPSRKALE
jgi:hypothetical protein